MIPEELESSTEEPLHNTNKWFLICLPVTGSGAYPENKPLTAVVLESIEPLTPTTTQENVFPQNQTHKYMHKHSTKICIKTLSFACYNKI